MDLDPVNLRHSVEIFTIELHAHAACHSGDGLTLLITTQIPRLSTYLACAHSPIWRDPCTWIMTSDRGPSVFEYSLRIVESYAWRLADIEQFYQVQTGSGPPPSFVQTIVKPITRIRPPCSSTLDALRSLQALLTSDVDVSLAIARLTVCACICVSILYYNTFGNCVNQLFVS